MTAAAVARPWPWARARRVASTVFRLGLGGVWVVAGALKVGDPDGMVRSVRAFRSLPESLVHPVAYGLPFVEVALGLLLVAGLATRFAAVVSGVLFAVYLAAIASAAARGLRIDCGCFSTGGDLAAGAPTRYTEKVVQDGLLLAASGLLAAWPRSYLALDRLLALDDPGDPGDPGNPDDPKNDLGDGTETALREHQAPHIPPVPRGSSSDVRGGSGSHGSLPHPAPASQPPRNLRQ